MKHVKFFGVAIIAIVLSAGFTACSDDDDDSGLNGNGKGNNSGTIKTENSVTLETAGTLSLVLGERVQYITSLKIKGPLNGDDITCLRQMLRCTREDADKRGMLTVLDLSDASIVAGGTGYEDDWYDTENNIIGTYMFRNCESLEKIALPNSVIWIEWGAFRECIGLTQVIIGNNTTSIGDYTFEDCYKLTNVTIGNSVTNISSRAFYGCNNLAYVTIGESLTSNSAFSGLTGIIEFDVAKGNEYLCSKDGVLYSKDMTMLIQFPAASSMTSYSIPEGVTEIASGAFGYCSGLTQVTIPSSVASIGSSAFYDCSGLTSVTIPNSVTEIGSYAFAYCYGLTEVIISENVTSIGSSAFSGCSGLTEITIPESVTSIGSSAFSGCSGLTEITIPESVTSIGNSAFTGCSSLTEVNFNAIACTSAGSYYYNRAFSGCNNITTFNFGDDVTIIPHYLCYNLTDLTSVTIPNSVTTIGGNAFYGCSGFKSITSLNPEPPTCSSYSFSGVDTSTCVLYVPLGSKEAYSTAYAWKDFTNIVEMN